MPTVNLTIGKNTYRIDCASGEEQKITDLAGLLNQRVVSLSDNLKGADEKTIFMLCGIMMLEELENLKKKSGKKSGDNNDQLEGQEELYKTIAANIENIADHVEKLVNKIKNY